jgi:hypothetical protein
MILQTALVLLREGRTEHRRQERHDLRIGPDVDHDKLELVVEERRGGVVDDEVMVG